MSMEVQQERLQLLRDFLNLQDVPKSYYSIGKFRDEAICIEAENDGWIVYEGDRGGRYNERHFKNFYEAGCYFLSRATYNQDHRAYLLSSFEKYWEKYEKQQSSIISKQKSSIIQSRLLMPALLLSVSVIFCLVIADVLFRIYLIYLAREDGLQLYLALDYSVLIIVLGLIIIIITNRFTGSGRLRLLLDKIAFINPFSWPIFLKIIIIVITIILLLYLRYS